MKEPSERNTGPPSSKQPELLPTPPQPPADLLFSIRVPSPFQLTPPLTAALSFAIISSLICLFYFLLLIRSPLLAISFLPLGR